MARSDMADIQAALMRGDIALAREILDDVQRVPDGEFPLPRWQRLRQHMDDGDIQHAICWCEAMTHRGTPAGLNARAAYRRAMEHGL